ncbi:MAG: glucoamylase family protein [Caldimonas sp.]
MSDVELDSLQATTLNYYIQEFNHTTGLMRDKTQAGAPSSIAAVGMALSTTPLVAERGIRTRALMAQRTLTILRFFANSRQGPEPDATGHKGFYYHFLDMETGRRVWDCELSTIDSAFLFAGMLVAATYFDGDDSSEAEIRRLARQLYERADWNWARNGEASVTHGWRPETGFIPYRWTGYDEALLLYVLGLGSPTSPLPEESYAAYTSTYTWKQIYEQEYLYSGPLFTHQLSHLWIDFRDIQDQFMREHGSNYFVNSRCATYAQQAYAIRNPMQFEGYGELCWGLTASDGPGCATHKVGGVERTFFDYLARGAPYGPDDGTIAPWAAVASLPFAPEIVLPTIRHFQKLELDLHEVYGFKATFNRTFPVAEGRFWASPFHIGIDQGPIALMIENYRTGLIWGLMRRCEPIRTGLRRAGFRGGWL